MRRAGEIKAASDWSGEAADRIVLDADQRYCRRMVLKGEQGTRFLIDLPHPTVLKDGDGLVLDDGAIIAIVSRVEPLVEIEATTPSSLLKIAWHLGNRHTEVEILDNRLRVRRDHVLEDLVCRLGARITYVNAPFEPERGAAHAHGREAEPHPRPAHGAKTNPAG